MLPVPHANLFAKAEPKSNPYEADFPRPASSTNGRTRISTPSCRSNVPLPIQPSTRMEAALSIPQAQLVTLRARAPTPLSWTVPEAL